MKKNLSVLRIEQVLIFIFTVLLFAGSCQKVYAYDDQSGDQSYVYNEYGYNVRIPDAYEYKEAYSLKEITGVAVTSLTDMFVREDGQIYVVDSEAGTIFCISKNMELLDTFSEFTLQNGEKTNLKRPNGVFASKELIYVADTGNSRILISDFKGNVQLIIEKPENILGTDLSSFLPTNVVVDSAGRISIIAKNINTGIMQFSAEGSFMGYIGAPKVQMDAFTKMLRKFSTDAQKAKMQTYVPTEYNNIKIDDKNFIWGTISSYKVKDFITAINTKTKKFDGKVTPIKKLNTMGSDVLRRKGVFAPLGDLMFMETPSKIIDVGLGPNQVYSMLDSTKGRIFTYNNDGILLYAFGNKGTKKGNTQNAIAIDYIDDEIVVLDAGLNQLIRYQPTAYGKLLIDAEGYYEEGEYEEANKMWEQVVELNSNFAYAYIGLGNAKYSTENYNEAMEYFEYANDRNDYSKAKEKLRKQKTQDIFPVIFVSIAGLILFQVTYQIVKKIRNYAIGDSQFNRKEEED